MKKTSGISLFTALGIRSEPTDPPPTPAAHAEPEADPVPDPSARSRFKSKKKPAVRTVKVSVTSPKLTLKKAQPDTTDPWEYHNYRMAEFRRLEESLPFLREEAERTSDQGDRNLLRRRIREIETHEEVSQYLCDTTDVLQAFLQEDSRLVEPTEDPSWREDTSGGITTFFKKYDNVEKERLREAFFEAAGVGVMKRKPVAATVTECPGCKGEIFGEFENEVVCRGCGLVVAVELFTQFSYKELKELTHKTRFTYKRINHFNEGLNNLQAKGNVKVDPSVVDAVRAELVKDRVTDPGKITVDLVREYLHKLNYSNYYDVISYICKQLTGKSPIQIPSQVEDQLRDMFLSTQAPYERLRPDGRSSYLNYRYTMYKLVEMLGLDELKPLFRLLKSTDKLRKHDEVWKLICEELGWTYYPTV